MIEPLTRKLSRDLEVGVSRSLDVHEYISIHYEPTLLGINDTHRYGRICDIIEEKVFGRACEPLVQQTVPNL